MKQQFTLKDLVQVYVREAPNQGSRFSDRIKKNSLISIGFVVRPNILVLRRIYRIAKRQRIFLKK